MPVLEPVSDEQASEPSGGKLVNYRDMKLALMTAGRITVLCSPGLRPPAHFRRCDSRSPPGTRFRFQMIPVALIR